MSQFESTEYPLKFEIIKKCSVSKARCSQLTLPHATLQTPQFMPVGTQGALKGVLPHQIKDLKCNLILGNTYHLGHRPGPELLTLAGGLHKYMNWDGNLLTDSGGFQMVSLLKLAKVTEDGVEFESPHDKSTMLLTPEKSMEIQNAIGADIMMQLDDVVCTTLEDTARMEEAMYRSIRWLDRCIAAHKRKSEQNLFPIVQGGLDARLRTISANELIKRNTSGYAIGGLSGGEAKEDFWKAVSLSTDILPDNKPRYLMGVGFAIDLVVCSALGCDLFDCVFPTRTARFGCALVDNGQLQLKRKNFAIDERPIDDECYCYTCQTYSRAYLHMVLNGDEVTACQLMSLHNVAYQMRLMQRIRDAIKNDTFPDFVRNFVRNYYSSGKNSNDTTSKNDKTEEISENKRGEKLIDGIPEWVVNSLKSVNINVL
ncbi:unnamed protein product [Brachionus calyciflorus]|uniref:Queuine tRNA-ribosyltransferase catalytic subunit 1 n=1 Tax=Brachionus calyciflorus TaxID=104777 RepID=A0A813SNH1_9BILA|nr:unnamed protein product [Brachionus calyciflorus]